MGGGVPKPGGTLGGSEQGECAERFPCPIGPGSLPGSQLGPTPSEAPSRLCWYWGHRREAEGE